jgi:adenylyltransferase/sulfurtransferase
VQLADTSFAVIGAGGLGGPVALALAAAGAGRLVLCDHDVVELGNLQRQIQFTARDLGRRKVDALAGELVRRGFPAARIDAVPARFEPALLDGVDVVVEGTDDPPTKFAVNDAAVARGLPFAIGAVERYSGQVLAALPGRTACYRCLFEDPPAADQAPTCADAGVLGAAVGAVGGLLAGAALLLATGDATSAGELWVLDDLTSRLPPRRVRYNRRRDCTACRT